MMMESEIVDILIPHASACGIATIKTALTIEMVDGSRMDRILARVQPAVEAYAKSQGLPAEGIMALLREEGHALVKETPIEGAWFTHSDAASC